MGTFDLRTGNPLAVLEAGLWLVFVVWAIALHLCRDADADPDRDDSGEPWTT